MDLGQIGENIARNFLEEKGYKFIEANYSFPSGELDLIMTHNNATVFVEVKSRNEANDISAPLDIPQYKIDRIQLTAEYYAAEHKIEDWRVEIIGITILNHGLAQISHHPLGS